MLISFSAFVGEGFGNHFIATSFVDTDIFSTGALNFMSIHLWIIHFFDSGFMTAKYFALANFVITPQFFLTGGTAEYQHNACVVGIKFFGEPVQGPWDLQV